jgi:membrane protein implicated in regulation of membrane protease activity
LFPDRANANVIPILTALVVGYFFLEPPWRWLILIPAVLIDILDIAVWLRWRKRKAITGEEGLVGTKGRVVSVDKPGVATIKARGQLWRAEIHGNVQLHDEVVVTAAEGIRLTVEAVPDSPIEGHLPDG